MKFLPTKYFLSIALGISLLIGAACTNMTPTQQGALSGGVIGAGAGAGISAISGGNAGVGAALGGALGVIGGALYGDQVERQRGYK